MPCHARDLGLQGPVCQPGGEGQLNHILPAGFLEATLATVEPLPANHGDCSSGLSASANGALIVDGTLAMLGYTILVGGTGNEAAQGLWTVVHPGSPATPWHLRRATQVYGSGSTCHVYGGNRNRETLWIFTRKRWVGVRPPGVAFGYLIGTTNANATWIIGDAVSNPEAGLRVTVMNLSFPVIEGRRYRIDGIINGTTSHDTLISVTAHIGTSQDGAFPFGSDANLAVNDIFARSGYWYYQARFSGTVEAILQGQAHGLGRLVLEPGLSRLDISDAGEL